jgi:adenylosuccinate lyase
MKLSKNSKLKLVTSPDNEIRAHITDSIFFGDSFSTREAKEIFGDERRMQRWLDVEIALADCQADLGMIPKSAALELAEMGDLKKFDIDKIKNEIKATKHSLVPLLRNWQSLVSKDTSQYIHFGVTTQDIQDTAQVLEVRDVINIVKRDLENIINQLAKLAKEYRDLTMVGRTHAQYAMPITLGLKIAGWLDECMRNYERLEECKHRLLVSELFGAVGTMSVFPEKGQALLQSFSKKLGLNVPNISWHNTRDRFVEFVSVLALITGGLGRIANEIIQLSRNEISELTEQFQSGQIGSSTMPQKRNPEDCENIVVLAKLVKNQAALSYDTLISEHERDYRTVRLEWSVITDASLYTCSALSSMLVILANLNVNEARIRQNVSSFASILSTEALMFFLSEKIHKQNAFNYIYDASLCALANDTNLIDELLKFEEIAVTFTKASLEKSINPFQYIGVSAQLVDEIISKSQLKFGIE